MAAALTLFTISAAAVIISSIRPAEASITPQQSVNAHLEQSIQDLLTDTNGTGRLLFDDIFFGTADVEEKDTPTNCSCKCGIVNQEIRIVGGRPTGVNRYPWVARLVYDGQFHCGASLLNGDYVLTAAHCVRRLKRSKIRVILGDHDQYVTTDAPAVMRAVSSVIRHRNFDLESYNHDIALLKLRKPVQFSKNISPVCLPQADRHYMYNRALALILTIIYENSSNLVKVEDNSLFFQ
uniref:Peptidase S1 domain-containing protein n=1 Tax=Rhodnius prolixus TaxID=13249 RepID=T1IDF5_RHOPR